MTAASAASGWVRISSQATYRKRLCPLRRGRLPRVAATGHWPDARLHLGLISQNSNWPNRIGSLPAEKLQSGIGWVSQMLAIRSALMKEEQIMHGTFSDPKHLQI